MYPAGDLGLEDGRDTFTGDWDSTLSDENIVLDPYLRGNMY